jgi:type II secretory pathway component GspD/PulD (secretin)/tetratricopeptide (TPR) repeat protein
LTRSRNSKLVVSAVCLTALGLGTLAYVEITAGSGKPSRTQVGQGAEHSALRPVFWQSTESARAGSVDVQPEVRPVVRPVERSAPAATPPARAAAPAVRTGAVNAKGLTRYEVTNRLSQAESAVFHGRFQAAQRLLSPLSDEGTLLEPQEREWMAKILGRMVRARELLAEGNRGVALVQDEPKKDDQPKVPEAKGDEPKAGDAKAPEDKNEAKAEVKADPAAAGLINEAEGFDKLIRQMTEAEFNKRYDAAEELLAKGDYERADATVLSAKSVVDQNALYLPNRGEDLLKKADDLRVRIRTDRKATEDRLKAEQEEAAKQRAIDGVLREREDKVRRIRQFLGNAEDSLREGDPARALEMYDLVLRIDPNNLTANARKEVVSDMYDHLVQAGINRTLRRQEVFTMTDMWEGRIPWYHEVRLPADWDELSRRRLERVSEDEDPAAVRERDRLDRNARRLLNSIKPALNLPGIPLNQAVDFIRESWGANIFVNWQALQDAGIDIEQVIQLNLKDVSLRTALETVFDIASGKLDPAQRPTFIVDAGVIHISTRELLAQRTATIVYDINDLVLIERIPPDPQQVQLSQFSQGSGVFQQGVQGGAQGGGQSVFGGGGQQTGFTQQQEEDARIALITDIINIVRTVDPETFVVDQADAPGQIREFKGSLIVRQTRANHDKIRKLLSDLRSISQKQVSIESRFVQVDASTVEQIIFDWDMDLVGLFGNFYRQNGSFATINTGGTASGDGARNGTFAVNPFATNGPHPVDLLQFNPATGGGTAFPSTSGSTGLSQISGNSVGFLLNGAILDDIGVRFFLMATQAANRANAYTAPKVTVMNGRKATIAVRLFQPYVANIKSNVGGGAGAVGVDPQIQLAESGTTMWVRPVISHDNRFVTLQLNPVLTNTNLQNIPVFGVTGNTVVPPTPGVPPTVIGGINIQQPQRFEQNVFTTVKVPDKGTVVLGGFKSSQEVENELGVPVLSKVPLIKRLVTNRSYGRDESVLLILVRPTIHLYEEIDPYNDVRPGQAINP